LGYRDAGVTTPFGCQFREMEMYVGWARLFAASGLVGVLYETSDPSTDAFAVLSHIRDHAAELGIDSARLGVWAGSGNVPVALAVLMQEGLRCGALCYGFMLDLDGATGVAQAAAQFHFANPSAGRSVEDLPRETALLIARAGKDQFPTLNPSLDAFAAAALRHNLPVTIMNHATGPHAFDILDDSDATRTVIRAVVEFLRANLKP
jgi:acetyl esterase/lipase